MSGSVGKQRITTIELTIIAATFITSLLKTGGHTHHRRSVLQTVGEMIFTAGSCYEPLVKFWPIINHRLVTQTGSDNL
jgi:hypothetical protein